MIRKIHFKKPNQNLLEIIKKDEELLEKVKDIDFAKNLYSSLSNTIWYNNVTKDIYSCSWRFAGGLVAELRNNNEDYLDFYCSGGEGNYYSEVYKIFKKFGYQTITDKSYEFVN